MTDRLLAARQSPRWFGVTLPEPSTACAATSFNPKLRRIGRRNVLLICGFRSLGGCCSVDGGSLGSGEGGRDGCAEEFEGAALDGGGFGQGRDDRAVLAVLHVVAGEGGEVGEQALVGVRGWPVAAGPGACFGVRGLASDRGCDGICSGGR